MKKYIKSYTSFTRAERLGLLCLSALLIILITIRATMYLWVHPANDIEKEKKLVVAWETFKRRQPAAKKTDADGNKNDYEDADDDNATPLPSIIDINTADSATLVRLKGIGPATAGKIVAYRENNGPFTNIDQLMEIRRFPEATFKILKEHLVVKTVK
jgi:competence ComEA-like helix-hairpin-helix protein